MRVNPDMRSGLLSALERVNDTEQQVLKQMSSGLRIQTPSDDPASAAAIVEVQADDQETNQYLVNIKSVRMQMQAADSALNAVGVALQRAVTLGVQGATGTLSSSDREAVIRELEGIKDQLLELANSSLQGNYLFGGTAVSSPPYLEDDSAPSGVLYQGNDNSRLIEVGQEYWIRAMLPGSAIFGDKNSGVFKSVSDLISAIDNDSGAEAATIALRGEAQEVAAARVHYGNGLNQLDSSDIIMNSRHVQFQEQLNNLCAADMAQVASNLVTAETSRNALLQSIAKTNGISLFDYLK